MIEMRNSTSKPIDNVLSSLKLRLEMFDTVEPQKRIEEVMMHYRNSIESNKSGKDELKKVIEGFQNIAQEGWSSGRQEDAVFILYCGFVLSDDNSKEKIKITLTQWRKKIGAIKFNELWSKATLGSPLPDGFDVEPKKGILFRLFNR